MGLSKVTICDLRQRPRQISKIPALCTEHGVAMVANVLKSQKAIKMSLTVVRAFVALRKLVLLNKDFGIQLEKLRKELHERIGEQDVQLSAIYDAIENLLDNQVVQKKWGRGAG